MLYNRQNSCFCWLLILGAISASMIPKLFATAFSPVAIPDVVAHSLSKMMTTTIASRPTSVAVFAASREESISGTDAEATSYMARIQELEMELAACILENESKAHERTPTDDDDGATATASGTSYEATATTKALTEKVAAYQHFISKYIVQAQIEKGEAIAETEKKYKTFISEYIVQAQTEKKEAVAEAEKKIRAQYE